MSFSYVFGNVDHLIQLGLLLASLVLLIVSFVLSDFKKKDRFRGLSLLFVILYLMFMQFEIFAYCIGSNWTGAF